jgi:hypothetical protein
MKTITETCIDLSIDPSAFKRTLQAAMNLANARRDLSESLSADFDALRDEGLTKEEEQLLKAALSYTIA